MNNGNSIIIIIILVLVATVTGLLTYKLIGNPIGMTSTTATNILTPTVKQIVNPSPIPSISISNLDVDLTEIQKEITQLDSDQKALSQIDQNLDTVTP